MAMVTGVVLGSSVAITLGLAVVAVIYLLIGTGEPAMQRELPALVRNTAIFMLISAVAAIAFRGEIKAARWCWWSRASLAAVFAAAAFHYWP